METQRRAKEGESDEETNVGSKKISMRSMSEREGERSGHRSVVHPRLQVILSIPSSANTRARLISLVSHLHPICIIQVMRVAAWPEHSDLGITSSPQPL